MPNATAQREQQFRAKLKALIEQAGYRDGVGFLNWDLQGSEIKGVFADDDGTKAFEYTVNGEGVAYKPLTGMRHDAYTKGIALTFLDPGRGRHQSITPSAAYLKGFRQDAVRGKKKNCTSPTAYSCGNSCINKNKQCRIRDIKVRQASLQLVGEAQQLKRQQLTDAISERELQRRIAEEEDRIRNLPNEQGVVVDSKTGKVLVNKKGEQTSVSFTPEEISHFKGNVLTHNHPNITNAPRSSPLYKGVSFSEADVSTACIAEMAEMRACSAGYNHSIKPPPGGWNAWFYHTRVKPSYQKNYNLTYREVMTDYYDGKISADQANVDFHHRVWTRTAAETGMVYRRTPIRATQRRQAA